MRLLALLSVLLLLLDASCTHAPMPHPKNPVPGHTDSLSLIGKWLWVKSIGGFSGSTIYPTSGENKIYIFNPDSSLFIIQSNATSNDTAFERYSTSADSSYYLYGGFSTMAMSVEPYHMSYHDRFHGDSLILREDASDGFTHWYVRM